MASFWNSREAYEQEQARLLAQRDEERAEQAAAAEAAKRTPEQIISDQFDEIERPYKEGWKI